MLPADHRRTSRRLLTPLVAVVAAVALGASACEPASSTAFVASNLEVREDGWRGVPLELDPPRQLPDVTLLDTAGDDVPVVETFSGRPTLLFFGYTSCPDICPIHLSTIASAMRSTGVSTAQLNVVFVSVDPERDSPERIDWYLRDQLRTSFVGLHGDIEVVADALGQLDLPGPVVEGPDPRGEGDLIGHPAQVIGFDADGVAQRVWPFGARRADWVADLPRIVAEWSVGAEPAPAADDGDPASVDDELPPEVDLGRAVDRVIEGGHGGGS